MDYSWTKIKQKLNNLKVFNQKKTFYKTRKSNPIQQINNRIKYILINSNQNQTSLIYNDKQDYKEMEKSLPIIDQKVLSFFKNEYIINSLSSDIEKNMKILSKDNIQGLNIDNRGLNEKTITKNEIDKKDIKNMRRTCNKSWFVISAKRRKVIISNLKHIKNKKNELPKIDTLHLDKNLLILRNNNTKNQNNYTNFLNKTKFLERLNKKTKKESFNRNYPRVLLGVDKIHKSNSTKKINISGKFPLIQKFKQNKISNDSKHNNDNYSFEELFSDGNKFLIINSIFS